MGLIRKRTIFHAEEALPDPEELKLRFRRRVLGFTFLGFLVVLGAPVARDLKIDLTARGEARRFVEQMIEARTIASASRLPVSLTMENNHQSWKRSLHAQGENCSLEAPGPQQLVPSEGIAWKLQAQREDGTKLEGQMLCWHPIKGLLLDSTPLQGGDLLVTLSSANDAQPGTNLAFVLATHGGAEIQMLTH